MRYKIFGIFLLLIVGVNLYIIISKIMQEKAREPFYYYGMVLAALALGTYFLFFKKRRA